jgi:hypothetical protein
MESALADDWTQIELQRRRNAKEIMHLAGTFPARRDCHFTP